MFLVLLFCACWHGCLPIINAHKTRGIGRGTRVPCPHLVHNPLLSQAQPGALEVHRARKHVELTSAAQCLTLAVRLFEIACHSIADQVFRRRSILIGGEADAAQASPDQ